MRRRELLGLGALGALASCARTRVQAPNKPLASTVAANSENSEAAKESADKRASAEPTQPSATPAEPPPVDDDATLRAKIGQLLLVGFRGQRAGADDIVSRDLQDYKLGGVLLFSRDNITGKRRRNIRSPAQLRALTDELRAAAGTTPPFIAIDQEGGFVNRLLQRDGFPKT
ncbi:MAG TPA: glycoside hydrolase family 3, partial [Nannocystis exedens]|nr:glycoside hydrolase family 3 [Nannocystis exedens]